MMAETRQAIPPEGDTRQPSQLWNWLRRGTALAFLLVVPVITLSHPAHPYALDGNPVVTIVLAAFGMALGVGALFVSAESTPAWPWVGEGMLVVGSALTVFSQAGDVFGCWVLVGLFVIVIRHSAAAACGKSTLRRLSWYGALAALSAATILEAARLLDVGQRADARLAAGANVATLCLLVSVGFAATWWFQGQVVAMRRAETA